MDPLEQFLIALVAALAQAIAGQVVPAVVAALQKPSTAEQSATPAGEEQAVLSAVQNAVKSGEAP